MPTTNLTADKFTAIAKHLYATDRAMFKTLLAASIWKSNEQTDENAWSCVDTCRRQFNLDATFAGWNITFLNGCQQFIGAKWMSYSMNAGVMPCSSGVTFENTLKRFSAKTATKRIARAIELRYISSGVHCHHIAEAIVAVGL